MPLCNVDKKTEDALERLAGNNYIGKARAPVSDSSVNDYKLKHLKQQ
jgi:hypothetical protein